MEVNGDEFGNLSLKIAVGMCSTEDLESKGVIILLSMQLNVINLRSIHVKRNVIFVTSPESRFKDHVYRIISHPNFLSFIDMLSQTE